MVTPSSAPAKRVSKADEVMDLFKECLNLYKASVGGYRGTAPTFAAPTCDGVAPTFDGSALQTLMDRMDGVESVLSRIEKKLLVRMEENSEITKKLMYGKDLNAIVDRVREENGAPPPPPPGDERKDVVECGVIPTKFSPEEGRYYVGGPLYKLPAVREIIKGFKGFKYDSENKQWSVRKEEAEELREALKAAGVEYEVVPEGPAA